MPSVEAALQSITRFADSPPARPRDPRDVARAASRRRRRRLYALAFGSAVVVAATSALVETPDARDDVVVAVPAPQPGPVTFLRVVLDAVESNAYYASAVDLDTWRREAEQAGSKASTTEETYSFVQRLVEALSPGATRTQGQSFVHPDRAVREVEGKGSGPTGLPVGSWTGAAGYIALVPNVSPATSSGGKQYNAAAQDLLAKRACGWVIDLRSSGPDARSDPLTMVSALGPLLGEGPIFGYRNTSGSVLTYSLKGDGSIVEDQGGSVVAPAPVRHVPKMSVPVAILQDSSTSTAFEIVAVSLRGRPATRSFGEPTAGRPVRTETFGLPDHSQLVLTTHVGVDRTGAAYEGPIPPDQLVVGAGREGTDAARGAADAWLAATAGCS